MSQVIKFIQFNAWYSVWRLIERVQLKEKGISRRTKPGTRAKAKGTTGEHKDKDEAGTE
jgi:hypothetical protein